MVDHLIKLPKNEITFFNSILDVIDCLQNIVENPNKLDYKNAIEFVKKIQKIEKPETKDLKAYDKLRIWISLDNVSDIVMDWAITEEVERK